MVVLARMGVGNRRQMRMRMEAVELRMARMMALVSRSNIHIVDAYSTLEEYGLQSDPLPCALVLMM